MKTKRKRKAHQKKTRKPVFSRALLAQAAREEGWKEGENNRARFVARNMLARNYPVTDIAEITGLSVEDIRALAAEPAIQGT